MADGGDQRETESEDLAAIGTGRNGKARRLQRGRHLARHVVPRNARRRQRRAGQGRAGRDRVRLGLP